MRRMWFGLEIDVVGLPPLPELGTLEWINFKREDQALIPISTILKFSAQSKLCFVVLELTT